MFSSFRDGQHKPDRGLLLSHLLLGSGVLPAGVYDRFDAFIRRHVRSENIRSCQRGVLSFTNYRKSTFFLLFKESFFIWKVIFHYGTYMSTQGVNMTNLGASFVLNNKVKFR